MGQGEARSPLRASTHIYKGEKYLQRRQRRAADVQDALDSFNLALNITVDNARALWGKGLALKLQGKHDAASKAFNEALRQSNAAEKKPEDERAVGEVLPDLARADIHWNLAVIFLERKEIEHAVVELESAALLDEGDPVIHTTMAHCYELSGDLHNALREYRKAKALDSSFSPGPMGELRVQGLLVEEARRAEEATAQEQKKDHCRVCQGWLPLESFSAKEKKRPRGKRRCQQCQSKGDGGE